MMEAKGIFTAGSQALIAHDARARDIMLRLQPGDRVLVKVHKARNPEHHRLAFAVLSRISEASGVPAEAILYYLKEQTGKVDIVRLPNGRHVPCPKSIRFESMPQDEFQAFWNEAWLIISERLLPGIPEKDFNEIRAIVAGNSSSPRVPHAGEEKAARLVPPDSDSRAATLVPAEVE